MSKRTNDSGWKRNSTVDYRIYDCRIQIVDVFGNHYRSGEDYLPYHRDQYDANGVKLHVISLSFGATRSFSFKGSNLGSDDQKYDLEEGDVIIFDPHMNENYTHGISKQTSIKDARINLTCFAIFKDKLPYGLKHYQHLDECDDRINLNHVMQMTGNDEIYARALQESEWME